MILNSLDERKTDIYVKKGVFKRLFIRKDGEIIDDIILRSINTLIGSSKNDDW